MAVSVTTFWMFRYFGLVWLKLQRNRHSRRRALYEASKRCMAALHAEEEVPEILCVLLTSQIFLSTLQRRSS